MFNQKRLLIYTSPVFVCFAVLISVKGMCADNILVDSLQKNIVWATGGLSAFYNKTHNSQQKGFDLNTRGIGGYIQSKLSDSFLIRLGYTYADTTAKVSDKKTNIDTDSYYVYGKFQPEKWYLAGQFNYHYARYKDRNDTLEIKSEKANIYQTTVMSGYHFGDVHNYSGLKYTYIDGKITNNHIIPHRNGEVLTAVIGTQYMPTYQVNKCTSLTPKLRLAGSYDLKSNNQLTIVDMSETNTVLALNGRRLHRLALKAGVGFGLQFKQVELSTDYDIDWRVSHISQTGKVSLKYHF